MNREDLGRVQKRRLRELLKQLKASDDRRLVLPPGAPEQATEERQRRLEEARSGLYPDRVLVAGRGWPEELELPLTVGRARRMISRCLEEMALELVVEITKTSELLIPGKEARRQALGHTDVFAGWPLPGGVMIRENRLELEGAEWAWAVLYGLMYSVVMDDGIEPSNLPPLDGEVAGCWPEEIAFQPVAKWAQRSLRRTVGRLEDERLGVQLLAHAEGNLVLAEEGRLPVDLRLETPSGIFRFSAVGTALLSYADGRNMEVMAIDTGWVHHSMLGKWRDLPKDGRRHRGDVATARRVDASRIELVAPGKDRVRLTLARDLLHDDFVEQLRRWWGWEGLRHWAALQRLFSVEGGRRGTVRWTLNDHLDAMGYNERSIFNPAVRARAAETVEAMTRIELAVYNQDGTLRMRRPILLKGGTYERLVDSRWELDGLELCINELLYEGVRRPSGRLGRDWFPVPTNLARLDHSIHPHALALGLLIPIRLRWRLGDDYRDLVISGEKLLRMGGIRWDPRRRSLAWEKLASSLEKLRSIRVIDSWEWQNGAPDPNCFCRITAPLYLTEQVDEKKKWPEILPVYVPMTGEELREWRRAQGRSQEELAAFLGVSDRTVRRGEKRGKKTLSKHLIQALKGWPERGDPSAEEEEEYLRL